MQKINLTIWLFRYEVIGIRPEYLRDAMPLKLVQRRIQDILCNGEPLWKIRPRSYGRARILVGHIVDHDLERLGLDYPAFMIRYRSLLSELLFLPYLP